MKVLNKLKRSQEDFNMLPIEFVNSDTNQYICYLLRTIEGGGLPLPWSKEVDTPRTEVTGIPDSARQLTR